MLVAWRDVKVSARLMLWIEAVSVATILIVVLLVLFRHGPHLDAEQLHLHAMTGSGLRLGLVLALFSFVGFESATTLGAEARNPLKTIPRAVIQSALLSGAIFVLCAYTEVLAFRIAGQDLGTSQAPMHVLADIGGIPIFGLIIDIGAMISMFACTLACITAAARVLLLMAHNGLAHGGLRTTHARNETPGHAHSSHRNRRGSAGGGAGHARRRRAGYLRMAGIAGDVWLHRGLRSGLFPIAKVSARAWSFSRWRANYSLAGRDRDGAGADR